MHLKPHPHAHINPAPHRTKRFETHHVRRIPVTLSEQAKEFIDGSTRQGRVFPQALSEFFGTLPEVERVEVDLTEDDKLMIHVKHTEHEHKHHRFHVASDDILSISPNPRHGFDAARTADELLRLYRTHVLKEGTN